MLHGIFKRAVRDRVILHNPCADTELPKVPVLAALAGMVAAVGPSRRAAKLDVLRAVVSD